MNIVPCGHRIVLEVHDITQVDTTYRKMKEMGLEVPESEDKQRKVAGLDRGKVVSVGPDAFKAFYRSSNPEDDKLENFKPWCKVGDLVLVAKYAGKLVEKDNLKYLIVNDEDVIGVISE